MLAQVASTAASAGLPIIFGLIGDALAAGDEEKAERLHAEARARFGDLKVPSLDEMRQGDTAFSDVNVDPVAKAAQRRAYERLMEMGTQTGLSVEDRAALDEARAETSRQEQGQRAAILEGARARGMGGSGMELQAQLAAQQGAADRNAMAGTQAAAEARRRAMQALVAAGGQASQARGQDFGEQAAKAQARDAISRFNAENVKDRYGMQANLAGQQYQVDTDAADRKSARADRTRRKWAGFGAAASNAVAGGADRFLGGK